MIIFRLFVKIKNTKKENVDNLHRLRYSGIGKHHVILNE